MGLTDATDGARSFDAMGPARLCGAPRGLVRSVRALAAAALLALAGALALPATAQADVLVSNIGTSSDAASSPIGSNWDHAQGFGTGANSSGYTLTSIEVKLMLVVVQEERVGCRCIA